VILLDTHVILWWQAGGDRLSSVARQHIAAARTVLVSPISFWEISILVAKGRLALDRDTSVWAQDFLETERVRLAEPTATVAVPRVDSRRPASKVTLPTPSCTPRPANEAFRWSARISASACMPRQHATCECSGSGE